MLRGELIRLGQEAARTMEEGERLRSEVGELKSARLSAEAVAARLEEMNALSIRVSLSECVYLFFGEGRGARGEGLLPPAAPAGRLQLHAEIALCGSSSSTARGPALPRRPRARGPADPAAPLANQNPCLASPPWLRARSAALLAPSTPTPTPPFAPPAQVASLKLEIAALKSEQDIREDELLAQIAVLQQQLARKKKRRSPGKMLKRMLSSAGESIKGLQSHPHPASPPPPGPDASPGAGGELRRSWGSLKSKFGKA